MRFTVSLVIAATVYVGILSWVLARSESAAPPVIVVRAPITTLPMPLPEPLPLPEDLPATVPEITTASLSGAIRARPTEAPKRTERDDPAPAAPEEDATRDDEPPVPENVDRPLDEPADEPASDAFADADPDDASSEDGLDLEAEPVADAAADAPEETTPSADPLDEPTREVDRAAESSREYADLPDDLKQLPDLIIETGENTDWAVIDEKLGIQTLAYTVDAEEPTTYLTWAPGGQAVDTEEVDLRPFSNRCRDRNNIGHFRRRLTRAKRDLGILRPMRVVGLVPNEVDRRFAATQLAAIRASGLEPAEVRSTVARYSVDERGDYGIVIQEIKPFEERRGMASGRQTN